MSASTAEEIRLDIDDNAARLAVKLVEQMATCDPQTVLDLQRLLRPFRVSRRLSAKQIYKAYAHIGCLYVDAIKVAIEKRRDHADSD